MVADLEQLADQGRDALQGPKVGREAPLGSALDQGVRELLALRCRQAGRATARLDRAHRFRPFALQRAAPRSCRLVADVEGLGDLVDAQALLD